MTKETRDQKIERYKNGYYDLIDALKGFPREMWAFKPSKDRWCIHEILVHIADSEANAFVKCRKLIAEPGKPVNDYQQDIWSHALDYMNQSTDEVLELFKMLRFTTYKIIQSLPDSTWRNAVGHSENKTVTLDDWLDIYANHIPDHIVQMKKNLDAWNKQQGTRTE